MELSEDIFRLNWSLIAFLLVFFLSFINISIVIYRKLRHKIPTSVNCWFCNTNSKVDYKLKNSWTCPTCQQYNGFTHDGSYNKTIPAQFIESLNSPLRPTSSNKNHLQNSNGLCTECNLNQELKLFQLSSFVSSSEANYDSEIENEQKRLEKVYALCPNCQINTERILTLKSTPQLAENFSKKQELISQTNSLKANKRSLNFETNSQNSSIYSQNGDSSASDDDLDETSSQLMRDKLHINLQHENTSYKNNRRNGKIIQPNLGFYSTNNYCQQEPLWRDYPEITKNPPHFTSSPAGSIFSGYKPNYSKTNDLLRPSVFSPSGQRANYFPHTQNYRYSNNELYYKNIFSPISRSSSQSSGFFDGFNSNKPSHEESLYSSAFRPPINFTTTQFANHPTLPTYFESMRKSEENCRSSRPKNKSQNSLYKTPQPLFSEDEEEDKDVAPKSNKPNVKEGKIGQKIISNGKKLKKRVRNNWLLVLVFLSLGLNLFLVVWHLKERHWDVVEKWIVGFDDILDGAKDLERYLDTKFKEGANATLLWTSHLIEGIKNMDVKLN